MIEAFEARHSKAPWFDRIERIRPGFVAQFCIYTDVHDDEVGWQEEVRSICEAALAMMQNDDPSVNVYGHGRRPDRTTADVSVKAGERFERELRTRAPSLNRARFGIR